VATFAKPSAVTADGSVTGHPSLTASAWFHRKAAEAIDVQVNADHLPRWVSHGEALLLPTWEQLVSAHPQGAKLEWIAKTDPRLYRAYPRIGGPAHGVRPEG
jgi:hypothetical protein